METRTFKCRVDEGTYGGEVTVCVDTELIEQQGNKAIEDAAWRAWRRKFGSSIGMAYTNVKILEEIE